MTAVRSALVIGGGLAGPVAAMALQKAGIEACVYEAFPSTAEGVGGGLAFAPNGRNALAVIGAEHVVDDRLPIPSLAFYSGTGERLSEIHEPPGLPPTVSLSRADFYQKIYEEAVSRGIRIQHGNRLVAADDTGGGVTAHFADGSQARAEVLIGADGIHSCVRSLIDSTAPQPTYTGLVSFGGYFSGSRLPATGGESRMTFGRSLFTGYTVGEDGRGHWFVNMPAEQPMSIEDMKARSATDWLRELSAKAAEDGNSIMGELLAAFSPDDLMINGASLYMQHVPLWHRGRMVLIGDSAHAPSSSSGQGASLAIEDGIQLARCLRDLPTPAEAFAAFETLRRPRAERVIADAEHSNTNKTAGGKNLSPVPEDAAWKYTYRIEWDAPVGPEAEAAATANPPSDQREPEQITTRNESEPRNATLTPDQRVTVRKAAYGAVTLVSMADQGVLATTKANIAGSKALNAATGLIGTILAGKDKFTITGRNTAEVVDDVLSAITSTVELLQAQDAAEAENFRATVTIAVEKAAAKVKPSPVLTEMIDKIRAALGERGATTGAGT